MEKSSLRIKSVLDRISRTTPAYVASASSRKQSKQQRRSSAGIGRDLPDALPGLAVEWNVDAESSWVWNDNQRGASNNDPELLTRLLRQSLFLPDKSDVLAEGKKVIPVEVLATAYRKFLERDNPPPISVAIKGGKNKGKGKYGAPFSIQRPQWPPPTSEVNGFDLLMLPCP